MKVLADNNIASETIAVLTEAGHEVLRVCDVASQDLTDREVIALAGELRSVLLTQDNDFHRRRRFDPKRYGGIIVLRDWQTDLGKVHARLATLLRSLSARDLRGTLVTIGRRSTRVRR
jgi:predicted nuclease of predicted toxin-antitoxin system